MVFNIGLLGVIMINEKTNNKIMAIIVSDRGNFLLLKTNPKTMKQDIWFVVTGSVEKGETKEEAVKREVNEETQLKILEMKPADYKCDYEWPKDSGKMNHEEAFIVKVKEAPVKISKWEHLDYKWLNKEQFLELIDWADNKEILKRLIE
jgi:NADH pyrophosphatase NudC (nudix superfamily)